MQLLFCCVRLIVDVYAAMVTSTMQRTKILWLLFTACCCLPSAAVVENGNTPCGDPTVTEAETCPQLLPSKVQIYTIDMHTRYVYIHTYMYVCTHAQMCAHTIHMHTHYICMCICVYRYMCTRAHTYTLYTNIYIYIYICTHSYRYTYIYIYIYIYI